MGRKENHFLNEDDIGSGEPNPGQEDVQRDVEAVNAAQAGHKQDGHLLQQIIDEQQYAEKKHSEAERNAGDSEDPGEDTLQNGTHLARIATQPMSDGMFEAQVYVRLAREPEVAETYIPAGTFPTEDQAWRAAYQRARRALESHEF
jgi:hypothetical protein